jgi:23S rRNA pseudoU1915 N3-methylase RlmH
LAEKVHDKRTVGHVLVCTSPKRTRRFRAEDFAAAMALKADFAAGWLFFRGGAAGVSNSVFCRLGLSMALSR